MGDIFNAVAAIYGYKTLKSLFEANSGLIFILAALLCVCLLFWKLLDRQFPRGGRDPVKTWIFKAVIVFGISAFVFVCAFTVFYEKKKLEESRLRQPAFSEIIQRYS
jgi:hypothetical protein